MSAITATRTPAGRTPRLRPPAEPTRKPMPRRRTVGRGAAVVGGGDRPVLRIVTERPATDPLPMVEPVLGPVVEGVSAAEAAPRRIDLDDFFAAEYVDDDVSVEIRRPRPSSVRLTRRGRLVVFGAAFAAVLGLGFVAATGSLASDQPEPTRVITVQPGQTLWDLAAAASHGGDVRATMSHLETLNHLDSTTLEVGQELRVPR